MRVALRGIVLGVALLAISAGTVLAQRASFSGPPELENRKITWRWEPLAGKDPYFEGNTVLDSLATKPGPQQGKDFRLLRASRDGRRLYGVYAGESRIYGWTYATGAVDVVLDAPPDTLLDFDVHSTGQLILGGLADGRIALWDLRTGTSPEIFAGHAGRCWKVKFIGPNTTVNDRVFASSSSQPNLKIWTSPGNVLITLNVPEPLISLDGTSDGNTILAGDRSGNLRVFTKTLGTWTIAPERPTGHVGPVVGIVFCADKTHAFSIDSQGKLLGWSPRKWTKNFEVQLDRVDGASLGVRDPDGALVYTLDSTGFFQIWDGQDGRRYRMASLSGGSSVQGVAVADLGRLLYLGLTDGSVRNYRTGFCSPSLTNPDCFGGYMIWRSPTPRAEDAMLLRTFGFGDSTWGFVGGERIFVDPDSLIPRGEHDERYQNVPLPGPFNGYPYYYSITDFSRRYLGGSIFEVGGDPASVQAGFFRIDPQSDPTPAVAHAPAWPDSEPPLLGRIIVVPNPYEAGKVPWDAQGGEHVDFLNLPDQATIKIYTTAGDHLRTIEHGKGEFGESSNREPWDLKNQQGEEVASGVYIYHISSTLTAEKAKGYFIVIR